ncbi:MAG: SDR family NAD(P)-dependent oxidoreductase [Syntrophaceae bacterium]|nr:SDR family NAD(P)-dependent oxidoreductase [Syntrophaceae bacterium]
MIPLEGKIALVTGGSRGIGRACVLGLARAGADVAVNYLIRQDLAKEVCSLVQGYGRRAFPFQADVSNSSEVNRMIGAVEERMGGVDILVNNAGIARRYPWDQVPEEGWDEIMRVNLKSAFLVTQAVLPGMRARKWGRIINISSGAAATGGVVGPYYAASKAGMLGMTHGYASLTLKEGITVNAVAPSLIETEMAHRDLRVDPKSTPIGRMGTVEEVSEVVVMLARNGYITGQTIFVNGGRHMT